VVAKQVCPKQSPGSVCEGQAGGWGMRSDVFITILDDAVMAHI
jgi:hypothetical protein